MLVNFLWRSIIFQLLWAKSTINFWFFLYEDLISWTSKNFQWTIIIFALMFLTFSLHNFIFKRVYHNFNLNAKNVYKFCPVRYDMNKVIVIVDNLLRNTKWISHCSTKIVPRINENSVETQLSHEIYNGLGMFTKCVPSVTAFDRAILVFAFLMGHDVLSYYL